MTKHIFIFFAAFCSLHIYANATPSDRDTVRSDGFCNHIEMLQPMRPVYLDGVVVPQRTELQGQPTVHTGISSCTCGSDVESARKQVC